MEIIKIIESNEGDVREKDFVWDTESGLTFKVKAIPEEEMTLITDMATDKVKSKRRKGKAVETDRIEFLRLVILKAVTGWTGMKVEHLLEVLNYKKFTFSKGTKKGVEIIFDPETLRTLSLIPSIEFIEFLTDAQKTLNEEVKAQREAELKN